jgi:hypothetical protein
MASYRDPITAKHHRSRSSAGLQTCYLEGDEPGDNWTEWTPSTKVALERLNTVVNGAAPGMTGRALWPKLKALPEGQSIEVFIDGYRRRYRIDPTPPSRVKHSTW